MGFTDLGVQRVFAHTMTVNVASRRVMEKCGLTLVHTVPYDGPDADIIDVAEHGEVEYALAKPEWKARTASAGLPGWSRARMAITAAMMAMVQGVASMDTGQTK
jgi:hypothetical protein